MKTIEINDAKMLGDLKKEFNDIFPFLSFEFCEPASTHKVIQEIKGVAVGKCRKAQAPAVLTISPEMSVLDLVKLLQEGFGLAVHVLRQAGDVWLKISKSSAWSLAEQNKLGQSITERLSR